MSKANMTPFFEWFKTLSSTKPWLVVGKGPSFSKVSSINLEDYLVVGLNHVMFKIPCLLGHAIDSEVYNKSDNKFLCRHLVTPWEPHIGFKPGNKSLVDLDAANRIGHKDVLYYNSSRTRKVSMRRGGPEVRVKLFGAVAVMNLLAMAGVRLVNTIGIDGGTSYHDEFNKSDLLCNGRSSFNDQFSEFNFTKKKYGLVISPM